MRMPEKIDVTSRSILEGLIKSNGEIYSMNSAFEWVIEKLNTSLNEEGLNLEVNIHRNLINTFWDIDVYEGDNIEWSIEFTYWEMNTTKSTYSVFILDKINEEFKVINSETSVIEVY